MGYAPPTDYSRPAVRSYGLNLNQGGPPTSLPEIATREEWIAARTQLLEREKELTRARDALIADRRRLADGPGGNGARRLAARRPA